MEANEYHHLDINWAYTDNPDPCRTAWACSRDDLLYSIFDDRNSGSICIYNFVSH